MKKKFKIVLLLSSTFLLGACSQSSDSNHDRIGIGKKLAMGEHWFSQKQVKEGKKVYGTQSFDQHLIDLVLEGRVDEETAIEYASNKDDFILKLKKSKLEKGVSTTEEGKIGLKIEE